VDRLLFFPKLPASVLPFCVPQTHAGSNVRMVAGAAEGGGDGASMCPRPADVDFVLGKCIDLLTAGSGCYSLVLWALLVGAL
jgi:hypothetical protein